MKKLLDEVRKTADEKIKEGGLHNFDAGKFPKEDRGVYFIYDSYEVIVYIGCVHDKKRSFYDRCNQYITNSNSGATFTFKIMEYILKKPVQFNKQAIINKDDMREAIQIIKKDYKIAFVKYNKKSPEILDKENFFIKLFNPKYNN